MQDNRVPNGADRRRRGVTYAAAVGAAAVGLTALGTAGLAGTAGAAGERATSTVVSSDGTVTKTIMIDAPTGVRATPTPGPGSVTPKYPQMRLEASYKRTGRTVTLTIELDGYVYEPLDAKNVPVKFPTPAKAGIGLGEKLAWGDGTTSNSAARPWHCGKPQNLHQVKDKYTVTKKYASSGDYTIVYSFEACGLNGGKITANVPLTF